MATLDQLRNKARELQPFSQKLLNPAIESYRKRYPSDGMDLVKLTKTMFPYLIFFVLSSLLARVPSLRAYPPVSYLPGLFFVLGFLVFASLFLKLAKIRMAQFKEGMALKRWIKHKTIKFLDESFEFAESVDFPAQLYKSCKLFENSYDRATAEDKCSGVIGKTPFELIEIGTYREERYKDSNGRTSRRYIPLFKGILFVADFNKKFNSHTIVRTDKAEKTFGKLGRSVQKMMGEFSELKLIELENVDFEKHFKVESNNPIEARYILTPTFMERLLGLREKYDENIQFAFMHSQVIIAIPHPRDFLSLGFDLTQVTNEIEFLAEELLSVLELVEDLELNNRIWNKEVV